MLEYALIASLVIMGLALLFGIIRLYKGPGAVDRVIIFDLFASIAIGMMAISYLWLKEGTMLDVGLLLSVVTFMGTITFARHLERKEKE